MIIRYQPPDEHLSYSELKYRIREECKKNPPVQETITVDNQGYEQPFYEVKRKDVEPASEIVKTLQKKIEDVTHERDSESSEVKILKEKTQPEMLKEIQERFYDEPGLINERSRLYRHKSSLYPHSRIREIFESRESIMAVAGHFDMIPTGLIIQTGSIEAARSLFFSTIIAEYLNLSESESSKRLQELVQYANALLQIGQHMESLRDWK